MFSWIRRTIQWWRRIRGRCPWCAEMMVRADPMDPAIRQDVSWRSFILCYCPQGHYLEEVSRAPEAVAAHKKFVGPVKPAVMIYQLNGHVIPELAEAMAEVERPVASLPSRRGRGLTAGRERRRWEDDDGE